MEDTGIIRKSSNKDDLDTIEELSERTDWWRLETLCRQYQIVPSPNRCEKIYESQLLDLYEVASGSIQPLTIDGYRLIRPFRTSSGAIIDAHSVHEYHSSQFGEYVLENYFENNED